MFTNSLFERAGGFTNITEPTWTFNNVNNMSGGTRNNVIYLEPFSCVCVGGRNIHIYSLREAPLMGDTDMQQREDMETWTQRHPPRANSLQTVTPATMAHSPFF